MRFLRINGEFGEGGGQIVRTAIALSCITQKPVSIENIRKKRKVPGLKAQHVTAIKILEKICDAKTEGVKVGSTKISFYPNKVKSKTLHENVGTAGSIPLILQVLIPVCAISKAKLDLSLIGGTDVKWSPTIDYTNYVLKEAYERMGIRFSLNVMKRGYYPRGGGKINLKVVPAKRIKPLVLKTRKTNNVKIFCSFSKVSRHIIEREIKHIQEDISKSGFLVESKIKNETAFDSGGSVLIFSNDENSIIGIDSLFDTKSGKFENYTSKRFLQSNQSLDENLADMIVVPASLAEGMTIFQVRKISKHLETNLYVTSKITGCRYGIGRLQDCYEVRIEGTSHSGIQQSSKEKNYD